MAKRKKKRKLPKSFEEFFVRLGAVFVAYAFNAIAAGALAGVNVFKSILMAGIMGVSTTFTYMARAYINDGAMSKTELDEAFKNTSNKLDSA